MVHNAEPEDRVRDDDEGGRVGVGGEAHTIDPAKPSVIPELKFDHSISMMADRFARYYDTATDKQYALAQLVTNLRLVHPVHQQRVLLALPPELQKELGEQATRMQGEMEAVRRLTK